MEQLEDPAAERLVFGGKELAQDLEATLLSVSIARDDTLFALGRVRGSGRGFEDTANPSKVAAEGSDARTLPRMQHLAARRTPTTGRLPALQTDLCDETAARKYFAHHRIRELFDRQAQCLFIHRPSDPFAFLQGDLSQHLFQRDDVRAIGFDGACPGQSHEPAPVTTDAPATKPPACGSATAPSTISSPNTGRVHLQLRKKIAADPKAFFAQADADNSADLSFEEWKATCKMSVDDVDDTVVRTLFTEIAERDDTISRSRFLMVAEEYRAARYFVEESTCFDVLVDNVMMMVRSKI